MDHRPEKRAVSEGGLLKEAIILAGGLGTRLRTAVPDLPKCMAPVAGKPFVSYIIDHFRQQGITHFIFALGYKSEAFEFFLQSKFPDGNYKVTIEQEPMGTGGAVKLACSAATSATVLVLNGDTYFNIDLAKLATVHSSHEADCTLSLKPMTAMDRYGVVELGADLQIQHFFEKKYYDSGLINGGAYALNTRSFLAEGLPDKFSFEQDYLEKYLKTRRISGAVQDEYFIDIGIPDDYQRAQSELPEIIKNH